MNVAELILFSILFSKSTFLYKIYIYIRSLHSRTFTRRCYMQVRNKNVKQLSKTNSNSIFRFSCTITLSLYGYFSSGRLLLRSLGTNGFHDVVTETNGREFIPVKSPRSIWEFMTAHTERGRGLVTRQKNRS